MNDKTLNSFADAFARAQAEQTKIVSALLGEISALNAKDAERSAAFDRLTKGDGETMTVTPPERELIAGLREGRFKLIGATPGGEPVRSPINSMDGLLKAVEALFNLTEKGECPCPECTAARAAKH